jgi:endonuclease-3
VQLQKELHSGEKQLFDLEWVLKAIRRAVRPFPKAAMFELADRGYRDPFQQLVGCIISIRTRDEVSLPESIKLLEAAPTPRKILGLGIATIDHLISRSTFHEAKAKQIYLIAQRVEEEFSGTLPCDFETLTSFRGVGPKCANLVLGVSCEQQKISVDIHVHRVCNRWGYVRTLSPELTLSELEKKLPKKYRIEINQLLVPFGKHICTGIKPKCSSCPVLAQCRQVGVTTHR